MKRKLWILTLLLLIPAFAFSAWVKQASGTVRNLRGVWHIDGYLYYQGTGLVVGDSGTILTTTDIGQTWVLRPSPTSQTLYGAAQALTWGFSNGFTSVVGGDTGGVILLTTNGGNAWSSRASPNSVMHAVSFSDTMNGWAAGGSGSIWRTSDGGFTWAFEAAPLPLDWHGVWFGSSYWGWVCGQNGTIMRTTDGGTTWENQSSGTTATLRAVCSINITEDVSVGDSGKILRTTNGGSTWNPVSSGVTDDLFGVIYLGGYNGYAVGANGRILRSSWDGSTWSPETSGTTQDLHGVFYFVMPDAGVHIWVVGDSGTILHQFIPIPGVEISSPSRRTPYASRLTVFPNPFIFYTSIPGHSSDLFTLYDISGRKVGTYKGDRIGQGLPAGVYFLRSEGNETQTLRIIKLK